MNRGQAAAKAGTVVLSVQNLQTGLGYFYSDQNYFPSAYEFGNKTLMLNYFNFFPAADFPSGNCPQTYNYSRLDKNSYELDFCLPTASQNFKSGWNSINQPQT